MQMRMSRDVSDLPCVTFNLPTRAASVSDCESFTTAGECPRQGTSARSEHREEWQHGLWAGRNERNRKTPERSPDREARQSNGRRRFPPLGESENESSYRSCRQP
jgi:hypothetical protein